MITVAVIITLAMLFAPYCSVAAQSIPGDIGQAIAPVAQATATIATNEPATEDNTNATEEKSLVRKILPFVLIILGLFILLYMYFFARTPAKRQQRRRK